jgi:hypothetical protein
MRNREVSEGNGFLLSVHLVIINTKVAEPVDLRQLIQNPAFGHDSESVPFS